MQMKFPLSARIRSLRSMARDSGVAARTKRSASLRNLRFNIPGLLFGLWFAPLFGWCFLVRQQRDERADDEHDPANPNPHRQRIVENLDDGFLPVMSWSGKNDVYIAFGGRIESDFMGCLRF